jgi:hypothetical protein
VSIFLCFFRNFKTAKKSKEISVLGFITLEETA